MKKIIVFLLCLVGIANAQTQTKYISVTPYLDSAAYAAKDVVGGVSAALNSGLLVFNNISCSTKANGYITSVTLTDKSDQAVEYDIVLFKSAPAIGSDGTCAATDYICDQSGFDPADTALLDMLPIINLATTDHFSYTTNGISSVSSLTSAARSYATSSLPGVIYAVIVTRGTPTYVGSRDLTLTLGFTCQ